MFPELCVILVTRSPNSPTAVPAAEVAVFATLEATFPTVPSPEEIVEEAAFNVLVITPLFLTESVAFDTCLIAPETRLPAVDVAVDAAVVATFWANESAPPITFPA